MAPHREQIVCTKQKWKCQKQHSKEESQNSLATTANCQQQFQKYWTESATTLNMSLLRSFRKFDFIFFPPQSCQPQTDKMRIKYKYTFAKDACKSVQKWTNKLKCSFLHQKASLFFSNDVLCRFSKHHHLVFEIFLEGWTKTGMNKATKTFSLIKTSKIM